MKLNSNKAYNCLDTFISLMSTCLKSIEVNKNDIIKNTKNAIELIGVKSFNNEIKRVFLKDNLI